MSLVAIHGTVRIGPVLAALAYLSKFDPRPSFRRLRKPMHADQRAHRDAQRGPTSAWQALAQSTRERYARQGKRRNRRILARLPNARKTRITRTELLMYSPVRWSMAHQKGARVGHGSRLPQRQYLYVTPKLIKEARAEFRRAVLARWLRSSP